MVRSPLHLGRPPGSVRRGPRCPRPKERLYSKKELSMPEGVVIVIRVKGGRPVIEELVRERELGKAFELVITLGGKEDDTMKSLPPAPVRSLGEPARRPAHQKFQSTIGLHKRKKGKKQSIEP